MLSRRSHIQEDLDNLELKGKELVKVLDGLSKINRKFGNTKQTLRAVKKQFKTHQILTIVDVGCGAADNLIAIASWCKSKNKKVKLIGIDGNQNSLEYARTKSAFDIEFRQADILDPNFEIPECDLLISSHFIYHFKDVEFVSFLKRSRLKVKKAMIFSELRRSYIARILFYPVALFFHRMVRSDGSKAIRRSFTRQELSEFIKEAGFKKFSVKNRLIFRLLAVIQLEK